MLRVFTSLEEQNLHVSSGAVRLVGSKTYVDLCIRANTSSFFLPLIPTRFPPSPSLVSRTVSKFTSGQCK